MLHLQEFTYLFMHSSRSQSSIRSQGSSTPTMFKNPYCVQEDLIQDESPLRLRI